MTEDPFFFDKERNVHFNVTSKQACDIIDRLKEAFEILDFCGEKS